MIQSDEVFSFIAKIEIIDINPYVLIPQEILEAIFLQANKSKGAIPVIGTICGKPFIQTLVKFRGEWRLYLNTPMRVESNTKVGDLATFEISFDSIPRETPMHPKLEVALNQNKEAQLIFERLSPSLQKEIKRYINHLKSEESIDKNVIKAINFLLGRERFIGRDEPK